MKKLSTTQRLFGRNDRAKPDSAAKKLQPRLSIKEQQQAQIENDKIY